MQKTTGPIYTDVYTNDPQPNTKAHNTRSRKRALLIGVQSIQGVTGITPLTSAVKDIQDWKANLRAHHGYSERDIVCLLDSPEVPSNLWPSYANIVAQMQLLTQETEAGDERFLFIAAHGYQIASTTDTELDGKDEAFWTWDGKILLDNTIRQEMVDSLGAGASLIAVVDTCHSGTLLDLPYEVSFQTGGARYFDAQKTPRRVVGNVLCVSSCTDDQKAGQIRRRGDHSQQGGLLTGLITWYLYSIMGGAVPTVQQLDTHLQTALANTSQKPMLTCGSTHAMEYFKL